jgi:hypothetical protein
MQQSPTILTKMFLWKYCRPLFMAVRRRRRAWRDAADPKKILEMGAIQREVVTRYGQKIQDGPFAGMLYLDEAAGSELVPKLIGSYEAEIHNRIVELSHPDRDVRIVNIGCAEGYYAVGMALLIPSASIYAFDIHPVAQERCGQLAQINGVADRVQVKGECTATSLNSILRAGDILICDCEGCEFAVLDPQQAPVLKTTHMIVELHDSDHLELNITPSLLARFRDSHEIELCSVKRRRDSDWRAVQFLNPSQRRIAIDEGRTLGQQWALMRAKI